MGKSSSHPLKYKRKASRVLVRTTTINPQNPTVDLAELLPDVGAPAILAAQIIRQAVDDLADARAGRQFTNCNYPCRLDPLADLQSFFAGEWFAFLAAHLGLDPAYVERITQRESIELAAPQFAD